MANKILVLASNPQDTEPLRLNPEIREIEDALKRGKKREPMVLKPKLAVRVDDLQQSIRQESARIVHFCGHGTGSQGLILETTSGKKQLLDNQAIADLFKLFTNQVECVVLNACHSRFQAVEISQHINYVICTKKEITDRAAIAFSKGFYEAIGDGESIAKAFEFGCNRIQLEIYGDSKQERKLVPVHSRAGSELVELPQHEVIELLIKEPLNIINDYSDSVPAQRSFNPRSPYKGLKRFNAKDKDLFFGREKLIKKLITAIQQSNLVLVLGASGSGKSSVVRAGVIPQIENSSETVYQSCLFTPDRNPFESFHSSLGNKDDISHSEIEFVKQGARETINQASNLLKSKHPQWLIFIDQFEELFTSCSNLETRRNFIQGIVDLAQDQDRSVKLILAMRSDFLEELGAYPEFSEIAEKNINLVADMQTEELCQAIEKPAAKHGVVFESGLVESIIRDVQGQAGSLPLLQYTLDLLWQDSDLSERILKSETYHQLGGVSGALQKHVNQIYQDLSPEQQLATKQILLRLVDVVALEQSEVLRTAVSRRAYKSDFTDTQAKTVQLLVDQNLLVSDELKQEKQATVEIAHEALLTSWTDLKDWISDARSTISLNNRLAEDAARWQSLRKENQEQANDELWTGSKLEKAIELRNDGTFDVVLGGLSESVNDFLDASIQKRDRKIRELRQRTWRLGILSSCAIVFALAASFLGIRSYLNSQVAQLEKQAADIKVKLSLGNEVEKLMESIELVGDNQQFHQRAFKSRTRLIPDVQSVLYQAEQNIREISILTNHQDEVNSVAISTDGKYLVSGSDDETVRLWDIANQSLLHTFTGHQDLVTSVAISSDGKYLVSGSWDRTVKLWSIPNQSLVHTFTGHQDLVTSVAISTDGKYIISGSYDNTVKLWGIPNQSLVHTFTGHQSSVNSVAISTDGKYLVSGSFDKTVKLWSIANQSLLHTFTSHKNPHIFTSHENSVRSVAISFDGKYIISGSSDNTVKLWNIYNKSLVHTFTGHQFDVNSVAISHDNKYIISGSDDDTTKLWNIPNQSLVHTFTGHQGSVSSVAISSDSKYLVSGSNNDDTVRLWSIPNKSLVHAFTGHQDSVTSVAISSDSKYIVSGSSDDTVRLWSIPNQSIVHTFTGHRSSVNSVKVSSDSKYIVSGSDDNTVTLWSIPNQSLIHTFTDYQSLVFAVDSVYSIAISSDGNYIVSGSYRAVKLWRGNNWKEWLAIACKRIRLHPALASSKIESAPNAAKICLKYGRWSDIEKAQFLVKQGLAIASELGDVELAKRKFRQASKLDSNNVNLEELEAEANQLATQFEQSKDE